MNTISIREPSPPLSFIILYILITLWIPGRKTKPVENTFSMFFVV
jgi:hypothetical protein